MVDIGLIQQNFRWSIYNMRPIRLNSTLINELTTRICIEYCINFYDSEPSIPESWPDNWSLIPSYQQEWNNLVALYEPIRMKFNNWQDPFSKGIWGLSQHAVNKSALKMLHHCQTNKCSLHNRFWIGTFDEQLICYWYGRDLSDQCDYWWIYSGGKLECR